MPVRDGAGNLVLRLESCVFQREQNGPREAGVVINEGDGPIIDMRGHIVLGPIWKWNPTRRHIMTLNDAVE